MKRRASRALPLLATMIALTIAGCSSLSGVGGSSGYACKAPEGVLCMSVSGVYANALQNNLPSQQMGKHPGDSDPALPQYAGAAPAAVNARTDTSSADASSLRSAPRILRLWIAPWEDSDGDLQDQAFVYVVVDTGRWLIEHTRPAIAREFAPIKPPAALPANRGTRPGAATGTTPSSGTTRPALPQGGSFEPDDDAQ